LEIALGIDLTSETARYEHRSAITGLLEPWFNGKDFAEVADRLAGSSVLWSEYRTFREVIADETLAGPGGLLSDIDQPGIGRYLAPSSPITIGSDVPEPVRCAPVLGEHSVSVLHELSVPPNDLQDLLSQGVVRDASTSPH
jgi:2-methylfumaryl-CoA isomerase